MLAEEVTYPKGCVNSQQTLRLIEGEEACFVSFLLTEQLRIRLGLYGVFYVTEVVKKNHDVSLRIDEAQENSIAFKEVGVSSNQGKEYYTCRSTV